MKTTKWRTKEGVEIEIKSMATPHLLATIHMIERSRLNNLLSIVAQDHFTQRDSRLLWPISSRIHRIM